MSMTPDELYKERLCRIEDAIKLKIPDRIPILASFRYFPARYTGMSYKDVYYKPKEWMEANKKTIIDFEPDMYYPPITDSGKANELLGPRHLKWPGHGIPDNVSHQYVEGEYLKANEYDEFLTDISNYLLRTFLPRIYESLKPLAELAPLDSLVFGSVAMLAQTLIRPDVEEALKTLQEAGREMKKTREAVSGFEKEMAENGFPSVGGFAITAFDVISDYHRGMKGSMLDMFQRPVKLMQAVEKLEPMLIKSAIASTKFSGNPRVHIPLHRGADGFMSDEQFRNFYWPGLKRLLLALIDEGLTPCPFFEGNVDSRLEYLRELPKGKIMARFDSTDILKAKEIIGDMICICGNMPVSILQVGTPDDVKSYCKKMIDVAGKGGGFVMCSRSVLDEARPENIKVWFEFTKEYGVYK
jgi:uroporphyrinogen-III decarboxylase